jgi:hypothetical protein
VTAQQQIAQQVNRYKYLILFKFKLVRDNADTPVWSRWALPLHFICRTE